MTLQEQIQLDLKHSMINKENDRRDILRIIMGEMSRNKTSKILTDEQIISIINKLVENATIMKNQTEINILTSYLPKTMDKCEIDIIVNNIMSEFNYNSSNQFGLILKELKNRYGTQIDNKTASEVIKSKFQ